MQLYNTIPFKIQSVYITSVNRQSAVVQNLCIFLSGISLNSIN